MFGRIGVVGRTIRYGGIGFKRWNSSTSASELKHFGELASSWWDVRGPQRILHKMNLLRVDYIQDTLKAHSKERPGYSLDLLPESERQKYLQGGEQQLMSALDVGCGGGIMSESLARLGFVKEVLAIDLSKDVLEVAKSHQRQDPAIQNKLEYQLKELKEVEGKFDMITMFEVLEHVTSPPEMLRLAIDRLKPGGWLFLSTINRTPVSWFTTIFMGEDVLRIVPRGTHTWSKYINEHELREWVVEQPDVQAVRSDGCLYIPACGWQLTKDHSIGNYFMAIRKM
jgi:polyprenyldihydroxybenzoate methyltransferase/3-demethylubiquinol 3-O-methyltransferase